MRGLLIAISTLALLVGIAISAFGATDTERIFEESVPLRSGGSVEIANVSGPVKVSGWDREEVSVVAVISVEKDDLDDDAEKMLEEVEIELEHSWNRVKIKTQYPEERWLKIVPENEESDIEIDIDLDDHDGEHNGLVDGIVSLVGKWVGGFTSWATDLVNQDIPVHVSYDIRVPHNCQLEMNNVTGDMLASGIEGDVDASLVSGKLSMTDVYGKLDCSVVNGDIELRDVAGAVEASIFNGSTFIGIAVNGEFNGVDCSMINGNAVISLPDGLAADLEFHTVNGMVNFDNELKLSDIVSAGSDFQAKLEDGGPRVKMNAVNGSVSVERGVM